VRPAALFRVPAAGAGAFDAAVARGRLTEAQRDALAAHLAHTLAFLARVEWHPGLAGGGEGPSEGDRLPLGSRLVALGDLYEVLTRPPGAEGLGQAPEQALALLREECAGSPGWLALLDALDRSR
jgi:hypothetical protein